MSSQVRRNLPSHCQISPRLRFSPSPNKSGDPQQDIFAEGLTEDTITELSRFSDLFVIAPNSSFHHRGKSPAVGQVGRELGVRYVVEGSVSFRYFPTLGLRLCTRHYDGNSPNTLARMLPGGASLA
jgi:TolB-like protein